MNKRNRNIIKEQAKLCKRLLSEVRGLPKTEYNSAAVKEIIQGYNGIHPLNMVQELRFAKEGHLAKISRAVIEHERMYLRKYNKCYFVEINLYGNFFTVKSAMIAAHYNFKPHLLASRSLILF